MASGTGLRRFSKTEPARKVSDVPRTHVGIGGGRLVASGTGAAWVLERGGLQPL